MKIYFIQAVIFTLIVQQSIQKQQVSEDEDTLLQIQQVYRHGARYPIWSDSGTDLEPSTTGELSNVGMRQHYILGTILRDLYIVKYKLIREQYNFTDIHIYSTDVNRTYMSCISQLQGLFQLPQSASVSIETSKTAIPPWPNSQNYAMNETEAISGGYIPFPIHSIQIERDYTCRGFEYVVCPNILKLQQEDKNSQDVKDLLKNPIFQNALQQFSKQTNVTNFDLNKIYQYVDTWMTMLYNDNFQSNKQYPNFDNKTWEIMHYFQVLSLHVNLYKSPKTIQMASSEFYRQLLQRMKLRLQNIENNVKNDLKDYKWFMNSAHDSTLGMIYASLDLQNWNCLSQKYNDKGDKCEIYDFPGFASSVIFELWSEKQTLKNYIKLRVNGTYVNFLKQGKKIYFEQFQEILQTKIIYDNYFDDCGLVQFQEKIVIQDVDHVPQWVIAILFVLGSIGVAGIFYLVYLIKKLNLIKKVNFIEDNADRNSVLSSNAQ